MLFSNSSNAGLHVRYEKAGLILDALPIPWNADAVIVEANVRLPAKASRAKADFTLRTVVDGPALSAELIAQENKTSRLRVFFRMAVPAQSCMAQVFWRAHLLGKIELPTIAQAKFEEGIALEMPTLCATFGGHMISCRAWVNAQAKNPFASAILRSPTPLAPALNQDFRVDVHSESGEHVASVAVPLVGTQLRVRQTLVSAPLPKLRSTGAYRVSWHFGARLLHSTPFRVVSKKAFLRSLRISATRFVVEMENGTIQTLRALPAHDGQPLLEGIRAVVPCFYLSSGEAGLAGLAAFTLRALKDDVVTTLGIENDLLVTDGPTPVVLGVVPAADLGRVTHFTLAVGDTILGNLPVLAAPKADFNAEGGFAPLDDFLWSPAAEEQLNDRLEKLLDGA